MRAICASVSQKRLLMSPLAFRAVNQKIGPPSMGPEPNQLSYSATSDAGERRGGCGGQAQKGRDGAGRVLDERAREPVAAMLEITFEWSRTSPGIAAGHRRGSLRPMRRRWISRRGCREPRSVCLRAGSATPGAGRRNTLTAEPGRFASRSCRKRGVGRRIGDAR